MGPKKKGPVTTLKELNPADYVRNPVKLHGIGDIPSLVPDRKGSLINIESLFPEWTSIDSENWSEITPADSVRDAKVPVFLGAATTVNLREFLHLDSGEEKEETGKKGKSAPKKDAKKGKKDVATELLDLKVDENGNPLPRVFIGPEVVNEGEDEDALALKGFNLVRPFQSFKVEKPNAAAEVLNMVTTDLEADEGEGGEEEEEEGENGEALPANNFTEVEIDRLMCAAFKLVRRFGPTVKTTLLDRNDSSPPSSSSQMEAKFPYLWRSIYPQTAAGKPCYNPAGKYCVKLFLAGAWRKVTVLDTVPLRADGLPALASSSQPLELWPLILSKALYTLFISCGYDKSLFADSDSPLSLPYNTSKTSSLIGFVVHALTGWQPGAPWTVSELVSNDEPRASLLLQEMLFGGASLIPPADIPGDIPRPSLAPLKGASVELTSLFLGPSGQSGSGGSLAGSDSQSVMSESNTASTQVLLTKKLFKEEYRRRQTERNVLLKAINARESKIAKIEGDLESAFSECFFICAPIEGSGAVEVLPILGLSYDEDCKDILEVKLLTSWQITGSEVEEFVQAPTVSSPAKPGSKEDLNDVNKPLPPCTVVDFSFISLKELVRRGAMVFGADTLLRHKHRVALGWHWKPVMPEGAPAAGGKGAAGGKAAPAAKKGAAAPAPEEDSNGLHIDPGPMPPVLLSINTSNFFEEGRATLSEEELAIQEQKREFGALGGNGSRPSSALKGGEASEVSSPVRANGLRAKSSHLSLSVLIHADLVNLSPATSTHANSTGRNTPNHRPSTATNTVAAAGAAGSSSTAASFLTEGVVVVLQEVQRGKSDPLVMRVELSGALNSLPLTRVTFHIPADRVPLEPMLFWVRLFTGASVYMNIACGVDISVGPAEDIWRRSGMHVLVKEGEAAPTRPFSEQVFFRVPLGFKALPDAERAAAAEVIDDDSGGEKNSLDESVIVFLHLSTKELTKSLSLVQHSILRGVDSFGLPRLQGDRLLVRGTPADQEPAPTSVLVGRSYPTPSESVPLPAFPWKLIILSRVPLLDLPVLPLASPSGEGSRYSGNYVPNNRLILFRDVFSVDKTSFPLAMRLTTMPTTKRAVVASNPTSAPSSAPSTRPNSSKPDLVASASTASHVTVVDEPDLDIDLSDSIWLVLRLFKKSDRSLAGEFRGRSVLELYHVALSDIIDAHHAPVVDEKAGKDKKAAPAKGKGAVQVEGAEFIVEVSLDETAMVIPARWRSRYPLFFDGRCCDEGTESYVHPLDHLVRPQFSWQVDFLAGSVLTVSHDTFDLERFTAKKNEWETAAEGRTERAQAAVAYFHLQQQQLGGAVYSHDQRHASPSPTAVSGAGATSDKDKLVTQLSLALNKPVPDLLPRIEVFEKATPYVEHVVEEGDKPRFVDVDEIEQNRILRGQQVEESIARADDAVARLHSFNEALKAASLQRAHLLVRAASKNGAAVARLWDQRETYRVGTNQRNEALKFLKQRCADAVQKVADEEAEKSGDANAKKKGGKDAKPAAAKKK